MQENPLPSSPPGTGPDLFTPPHMLSVVMELFAGDRQHALSQQDQLFTHLMVCSYCRTAVIVLLTIAQEYDRRNNHPEEPTSELLRRFAGINRTLEAYQVREAHESERLAVYAEVMHSGGQEQAAQRDPALAAHLETCPDCRLAVEATVAFLSDSPT